MDRRELLRVFGATAALALLPHEATAAAWARVARGVRASDGLTDAQLALVRTLADAILPRTDTPGAVDVGVPAFVDAVVSGSDRDDDRQAFLSGLDALATRIGGGASDTVGQAIESIESERDRRAQPMRAYWRLKGLIVHGYFTSEPVMKQVLGVEIMPGKFDGAAPMPLRRASSRGDAHA